MNGIYVFLALAHIYNPEFGIRSFALPSFAKKWLILKREYEWFAFVAL